ncbi:MAG: tyrosine-type recombinase/integrase [Planctomycetota bacterium]|nr:tyrosine-type recombinase/integrase [Planctomycetota bacterium]
MTTREQAVRLARRKSEDLVSATRRDRHRRKHNRPRSTVADALSVYVEHVLLERRDRGEEYQARAKARLEQHLRPFVAFVGAKRCERLTVDDLDDYRAELGEVGRLENSSINRFLDAARAAVNFMIDRRYIDFDSREAGKALKHYKTERKKPLILDREELLRMIDALRRREAGVKAKVRRHVTRGPQAGKVQEFEQSVARQRKPLAPYFALALLTGCRPGEIEALTADDVRLGHGNVLVHASKTNAEREIPLHDSPLLRELVTSLKLRAAGGALVGRVKRDRVMRLAVSARVKLYEDELGITRSKVNRQMLRRTTVAHVAAGSPEGEGLLQFRFGHTQNVSITHYRRALHGIRERGQTVEEWLGVADELRELLQDLGYIQRQASALEAAN